MSWLVRSEQKISFQCFKNYFILCAWCFACVYMSVQHVCACIGQKRALDTLKLQDGSQLPHSGSQPPVTPALSNVPPPSGLCRHCTHIHTRMNNKIHLVGGGGSSRNKIRKEKETQVLCTAVTKKFHMKMSISECFLLLPFHCKQDSWSYMVEGEKQLLPAAISPPHTGHGMHGHIICKLMQVLKIK